MAFESCLAQGPSTPARPPSHKLRSAGLEETCGFLPAPRFVRPLATRLTAHGSRLTANAPRQHGLHHTSPKNISPGTGESSGESSGEGVRRGSSGTGGEFGGGVRGRSPNSTGDRGQLPISLFLSRIGPCDGDLGEDSFFALGRSGSGKAAKPLTWRETFTNSFPHSLRYGGSGELVFLCTPDRAA